MRILVDAVGQHAALVEAHIAGRCADQTAYGVFLHIFRHIEPHQFNAQSVGQLLGNLSLANAGWAREEIVADRLFRLSQTSAAEFDCARQRLNRFFLTEHNALQ